MKSVELTLVSGSKATFFINSNIIVYEDSSENYPKLRCRILDGIHNNGGWMIQEDYKTVVRMIKEANTI